MSDTGFTEIFSGNDCNSQRSHTVQNNVFPIYRLKMLIPNSHLLPGKGSVPEIFFFGNNPLIGGLMAELRMPSIKTATCRMRMPHLTTVKGLLIWFVDI